MVLRRRAITALAALALGATTTASAEARGFRGGGFGPVAGFAAVAGLAVSALATGAAYDFYSRPAGAEGQGAPKREAGAGGIYLYGPQGY